MAMSFETLKVAIGLATRSLAAELVLNDGMPFTRMPTADEYRVAFVVDCEPFDVVLDGERVSTLRSNVGDLTEYVQLEMRRALERSKVGGG